MRVIARVLALLIVLFIVPSTACAFWLFNANRVAFDRATYNDALQSPFLYGDTLAALLEGFTSMTPVPRDANAILTRINPDGWQGISARVLPDEQGRAVLSSLISAFFNWLETPGQTLAGVGFQLTEIKSRLTNDAVRDQLRTVIDREPPCNPDQAQKLAAFKLDSTSFAELPICRPESAALIEKEQAALVSALGIIAAQLPNDWSLAEEINRQVNDAPPQPPSLVPGQQPPPVARSIRAGQIDQVRAGIRLQSRLLVLLFLIPVAFLCVIIIVTIRSVKAFFRWTGWVLVVSGIISLLPVFLLPALNSGFARTPLSTQADFGTGGRALFVFFVAMLQSFVNQLTLSVLFQVAGLIVIGLMLVFISVALPHGVELDEDDQLALLKQQA